jgi:hypothetical protein
MVYDDYKHRLETDPGREKLTVVAWKKRFRAADPNLRNLWTPGRIHTASTRFMVKAFLQELWVKWRTLEDLPVTLPYSEAKLGMPPHGGPSMTSNPTTESEPDRSRTPSERSEPSFASNPPKGSEPSCLSNPSEASGP